MDGAMINRPARLSPVESIALSMIELGPISVPQLADAMAREASPVSRLVHALRGRGWVERLEAGAGRRPAIWGITEAGRAALAQGGA